MAFAPQWRTTHAFNSAGADGIDNSSAVADVTEQLIMFRSGGLN